MKRILSVASGLDNSLSFLVHDDVIVDAFDYNPSQIALGDLKITAIKYLSYGELLTLLGIEDGNRIDLYQRISSYLAQETKDYFDSHLFLIEEGMCHMGRFESYFHLFRNKVFPLVLSKRKIEAFSQITSIEEQKKYYRNYVDTWRFRLMFKIFFSERVMSKKGRDKAFFSYSTGKLSEILKNRVDVGFSKHPNGVNPYYSYVLRNTYKNALPFYLEYENYLKIKKNIDHIHLHHKAFDDMLEESYDFMNLSDIFEYMSDDVAKSYEDKIIKHLNPNGRIAFYNMMNIRKMPTMQRINTESDIEENRAFFYRDYLVYELN